MLAQNWLAEVRLGGVPGAAKTEARKAPTVKELCVKFMEDYSKHRNKPSTQKCYTRVRPACARRTGSSLRWLPMTCTAPIITWPRPGRRPCSPAILPTWWQAHVRRLEALRRVGIYRRSVMLASGRYAMFNDGMGFSLVSGGGVSWEIGRHRGQTIT